MQLAQLSASECGWWLTARLVSFWQHPEVLQDEVYGLMHRITTLQALLAVGAAHDCEIEQLDARTEYSSAPLELEIYMKMPPRHSDNEGDDRAVLKLERALYGVKLEGCTWQQKLKETTMEAEGFGMAESDDGPHFMLDSRGCYS